MAEPVCLIKANTGSEWARRQLVLPLGLCMLQMGKPNIRRAVSENA